MSGDSAKQLVDVGNDEPKPPHNELLQQLGLALTSSDDDILATFFCKKKQSGTVSNFLNDSILKSCA